MRDVRHPLAPALPLRTDDGCILDTAGRLVATCRDQHAARTLVAGMDAIELAEEAAQHELDAEHAEDRADAAESREREALAILARLIGEPTDMDWDRACELVEERL
jgi:hypothetical protein